MITRIPYTGYGTVEQRENPPRDERFTQRPKIMISFQQGESQGKTCHAWRMVYQEADDALNMTAHHVPLKQITQTKKIYKVDRHFVSLDEHTQVTKQQRKRDCFLLLKNYCILPRYYFSYSLLPKDTVPTGYLLTYQVPKNLVAGS